MPILYLNNLSSENRRKDADLSLARYLTFIAGAANAGGFLAVQMYTSHMSGIVATIADNLILGQFKLILTALFALFAFIAGAGTTAILVNWGGRNKLHSIYALPLLLEGILLLGFGVAGRFLSNEIWLSVPMTVMLLCFLMGLQNALITKISRAEIRTTHITGMVTDLGIELGKLVYWNHEANVRRNQRVFANRAKLKVLASLIGLFLFGGIVGAAGFKYFGYAFTLPLATLIVLIGVVPAAKDLRLAWRRFRMRRALRNE